MKTLGLLRHAKSDWDDLGKRDFDRGLSDRGRRGARLIGRHIFEHGVEWDTILASTAERVKRTIDSALPDSEPTWDARLYLASVETIFEVIRDHAGKADAVLVSGHNPGLQEVLFALVAPNEENKQFDEASRKFPTSAFAVFELDIDDWADLRKECGRLVHFIRPRDLDPELGPQGN